MGKKKISKAIVGIDISAKTLDVFLVGKSTQKKVFQNNAIGHKNLIKVLKKQRIPCEITLEATGIYSLDVSLRLARVPDFKVQVLNPRIASDFRKALGKRSKTDRVDAEVLAEYGKRMEFTTWTPPAKRLLDLRSIVRRISTVKDQSVQEKNRRHAMEQTEELTSLISEDIDESLVAIKSRIDRLTAAALQLVGEDQELLHKMEIITSIKGFGEVSALQVLSELSLLPADMTVKQWVAHAGLDPRHLVSGTSVNKKTRITKAGNRYLRKALFMPALAAIHWSPEVKGFFDELCSRGKAKMQAVVAVMRKLLHAVYGMIKTDTLWDPKMFRPSTKRLI